MGDAGGVVGEARVWVWWWGAEGVDAGVLVAEQARGTLCVDGAGGLFGGAEGAGVVVCDAGVADGAGPGGGGAGEGLGAGDDVDGGLGEAVAVDEAGADVVGAFVVVGVSKFWFTNDELGGVAGVEDVSGDVALGAGGLAGV